MASIPTFSRVVCIALIDSAGKVLLQKRRPEVTDGGLWEFPGGKIEPGETGESALVREIAEELGIAVALGDLRREGESMRGSASGGGLVLILYSCTRWKGEPRCLDGEAIAWFAAGEVADLAVPPLDRPFVERLPAIIASASGEPPLHLGFRR